MRAGGDEGWLGDGEQWGNRRLARRSGVCRRSEQVNVRITRSISCNPRSAPLSPYVFIRQRRLPAQPSRSLGRPRRGPTISGPHPGTPCRASCPCFPLAFLLPSTARRPALTRGVARRHPRGRWRRWWARLRCGPSRRAARRGERRGAGSGWFRRRSL